MEYRLRLMCRINYYLYVVGTLEKIRIELKTTNMTEVN